MVDDVLAERDSAREGFFKQPGKPKLTPDNIAFAAWHVLDELGLDKPIDGFKMRIFFLDGSCCDVGYAKRPTPRDIIEACGWEDPVV